MQLYICPDKYFSLVLSNVKSTSKCFSINNGAINSAADIPIKFLDQQIRVKSSKEPVIQTVYFHFLNNVWPRLMPALSEVTLKYGSIETLYLPHYSFT